MLVKTSRPDSQPQTIADRRHKPYSVAEDIERAIDALPPQELAKLYAWLDRRRSQRAAQPGATVFEQGFGLFGSPDDAALIDEVVHIAYEGRRPSRPVHTFQRMSKSFLDTDILPEYLKGHHRTVIRRAADYARQHGVFTFTSVTVHEIAYGLELKGAAAQLQKVLFG